MSTLVNVRELAALLKARRGGRGLREVAKEIGNVSASTLSRVEQGKVPDLDTFMQLCKWLDVSADQFMPASAATRSQVKTRTTPELITAHLRTDRTLDPETAEALAKTIELAYTAASKGRTARK